MLWFWTGFTLSFFCLRMAKGEVNYNPQNFARWLLGIRAEYQNWHTFKIWEDLATGQENAAFPSKVNLEFGASCESLLMWNATWAVLSQHFQLWKRGCDTGPLRHNFSTWTVIAFYLYMFFFDSPADGTKSQVQPAAHMTACWLSCNVANRFEFCSRLANPIWTACSEDKFLQSNQTRKNVSDCTEYQCCHFHSAWRTLPNRNPQSSWGFPNFRACPWTLGQHKGFLYDFRDSGISDDF